MGGLAYGGFYVGLMHGFCECKMLMLFFLGWVQRIEPDILGEGSAMGNGAPAKHARLSTCFLGPEVSQIRTCNLPPSPCVKNTEIKGYQQNPRARSM
jgi:hypothetical protein